jgi:hypothetical protein
MHVQWNYDLKSVPPEIVICKINSVNKHSVNKYDDMYYISH